MRKFTKFKNILEFIEKIDIAGLTNSIPIIIIGKIEIELPAIYIINKFIGTCLNGPNAMSHERLANKLLSTFCTLSLEN